jgi:hypothetical protein
MQTFIDIMLYAALVLGGLGALAAFFVFVSYGIVSLTDDPAAEEEH